MSNNELDITGLTEHMNISYDIKIENKPDIQFIYYVMSGIHPADLDHFDEKTLIMFNTIAFIMDDHDVKWMSMNKLRYNNIEKTLKSTYAFLKKHRDFNYIHRMILHFRNISKDFKKMTDLEKDNYISEVLLFIEFIFIEILDVDRSNLKKLKTFVYGMLFVILIYIMLAVMSLYYNRFYCLG